MKEIVKIVQTVLTDVDASITAYIAQILHESLNSSVTHRHQHYVKIHVLSILYL